MVFDAQNSNKINHTDTRTFYSMKSQALTTTASTDLQSLLDSQTFSCLLERLAEESAAQNSKGKSSLNETMEVKTPSTVSTTMRGRGSAISRSLRPGSRSKSKIRPKLESRCILDSQIAVTGHPMDNVLYQQPIGKSVILGENSTLGRKVLTDRAVYYGEVELPYLHSSDAISSLYQRPKAHQKSSQLNPQPLINPPSSINFHLLTNLKNLFLYYTQLDSLRQLGTGWSNLKSLTIMCSPQLVDLAGLSIFPSLEYLFVPHNCIRDISDLMYHSALRCVDLEDNLLDSMDQMEYLYTIGTLEWVDISRNPVTTMKQKYRMLCEKLGNIVQIQDCNKPYEYQLAEYELDAEVYSYEHMQVSNGLIKDINDQIIGQEIPVGQHWRKIQANLKAEAQGKQQTKQADVQILEAFVEQDEDSWGDDVQYGEDAVEDRLRLRVTPLTEYVQGKLDVSSLKKYFQNKICPQATKPQKQKESQSADSQKPESSIEARPHKFAATQKLPSTATAATMGEQKKRQTSSSIRKKVGRISISKIGNMPQATSSILASMKNKQEVGEGNMNCGSNMRFIGKRRLLTKLADEVAH